MASSRAQVIGLWAFAGLFIILCFTPGFFFAPSQHSRHVRRAQDIPITQPLPVRSVPIIEKHSAGHQNPQVAPPVPLEQALHIPLETTETNSTSARFSVNPRGLHGSVLDARDSGPLYCTNGPCVDGSCCGKSGICGYGPDYCGDGCQSQCDAKAMCGVYSEDKAYACGMDLCCSATGWCGTTEVYCNNADPLHGTLPCQAGYGSCQEYPSPSCAAGGGSTKGRSVGYYQSWNVRERKCNTVTPKQLDTSLYTHLFYSFASINPTTFAVENAHPDDSSMIPEFTSLSKNGGPQTWIAIGGFDFSDPTRVTHTTWSDLCSTQANRAAFIASLKTYMDQNGFQGVDLDWEYPGAPERGGRKLEDVKNFPKLLREMRAAFGQTYGISLTLAPDYWYLRWFDAKAMEPYVDFFGFMSYDLHGSWDQDVKTLGKLVRGQADIREIDKNVVPLWFAGLDPAKINFGLAMYGRGYTLSSPACNNLLCSFSGPSKGGPCTGFDGVLSLYEIKRLIKEKGLTPRYNADSLMKELVWDDQWIGYDDEETFAAKKAWADSKCFGGTMYWGIDYGVEGSGGSDDDGYPVVYLDPTVYQGVPAQCTPPCRLVFPPSPLSEPTTISIPPYTTSIELASGTTTTITVTVPALTATSMSYSNMIIPSGQGSTIISPYQSEPVPPVTTVIGGQTRTLILPPWPLITNGPPDSWNFPTGVPSASSSTSKTTVVPIPLPIFTPDTALVQLPSVSKPEFTPPTPVKAWPTGIWITPVSTPVPDEGEDDDVDPEHVWKTPCDLWFFSLCISLPGPFNIDIRGWRWNLPVGTWGPGVAPPGLNLPPGMTLKGVLPPWPKITVHPGGRVEPAAKPADCTPAEASLCVTKNYFATTVQAGGITVTTATSTTETCATITGCHLKDVETEVNNDVCTLRARAVVEAAATTTTSFMSEKTQIAAGEAVVSHHDSGVADNEQENDNAVHHLQARAPAYPNWACDTVGEEAILWPQTGGDAAAQATIRQALDDWKAARDGLKDGESYNYVEIKSTVLGFTAFYAITNLGATALAWFNSQSITEVHMGYYPAHPARPAHITARGQDDGMMGPLDRDGSRNMTKRTMIGKSDSAWHLSLASWPNGFNFDQAATSQQHTHDPANDQYASFWDDSYGKDQTIYIMEHGMSSYPNEFLKRRDLPASQVYNYQPSAGDNDHGTQVAAMAGSQSIGIAKNAELVFAQFDLDKHESILETLCKIADDVAKITKDTCVVNMSWGHPNAVSVDFYKIMTYLMQRLTDDYGCLFTVAPGNTAGQAAMYPALAVQNVKGLLVVGAVDKLGQPVSWNSGMNLINALAPGDGIAFQGQTTISGTSFAAPMAAGLAAYLRGLPSYTGGRDAQSVSQKMTSLARVVDMGNHPTSPYPILWNGSKGLVCTVTRKRGLAGRQSSDTCELEPGSGGSGGGSGTGSGSGSGSGPSGPPVTFRPGPPAPICTANCGILCTGFYCTANPSGHPPDFTPPTSTSSTSTSAGFTPTKATIDPSLLPTLSAVPTGGPIPTDCASVSTWTTCALGLPPGASACQTFSTCVSTKEPPKPTTTTTAQQQPAPAPAPSNNCSPPVYFDTRPDCIGHNYYKCVSALNIGCAIGCAQNNKLHQSQCNSQCMNRNSADCASYCSTITDCQSCINSYKYRFDSDDETMPRRICSRKGTPNYYCDC